MAGVMKYILDTYDYLFDDLADPRTKDFFLMSGPIPVLILTGLYLYVCTSFGPRYMKHKRPYNLKYVVFFYNLFQIIMNIGLLYEGSVYIFSDKFSFQCDPIDYSNSPRAVRVVSVVWWYFFSKLIDLLDTIFFVLRKKNNQISFLHVYHHSIIVVSTWIGVKYFAGGHSVMFGTLNSFVHVVMYTYYLIAGLGPEYQKYVWWKKHVTIVQLVQFIIVVCHNVYPLFIDCGYPKILNILVCMNSLFFINLFARFFIAAYVTENKRKDSFIRNGSAESKHNRIRGSSKDE